jgi:hypothetical protein
LKRSVLLLGVGLPGALVAQDVVTLGKEAEAVDAIAAWMLGRLFEKDIR